MFIKRNCYKKLFLNLFIFVFVILSMIKFYFSDTYLLMVSDVGHIKFIKNWSSVLLSIKVPFAYNTIGLVLPTYTIKLITHKNFGLDRIDILHISALALCGIALDIGVLPINRNGLNDFISKTEHMSEKELLRIYGSLDTFDVLHIRKYIKQLFADVLRNMAIVCGSILIDNIHQMSTCINAF